MPLWCLSICGSYRSYLFREYKLCHLLLRPLCDRASAGHRSYTGLRGYSRQTADSCLSSLSRGPNSAKEVDLSDSGAWREAQGGGGGGETTLFKYKRPGSRAVSLPIYAGLGKFNKGKVIGQPRRLNIYSRLATVVRDKIQEDLKMLKLKKEDADDRNKWRRRIRVADPSPRRD